MFSKFLYIRSIRKHAIDPIQQAITNKMRAMTENEIELALLDEKSSLI